MICKTAMMEEPLLQKKAQLKASKTNTTLLTTESMKDLERGQSVSVINQVKKTWANATVSNITLFVVQPDNWAACAIIACFIWTLFSFVLDGLIPGDPAEQNVLTNIYGAEDVDDNGNPTGRTDENGDPIVHHHWPAVFAGIMCTAGLSIGVVYMVRKSALIEQIYQFRALNQQYDTQVLKLAEQSEILTATSDKLKLELANFSDLQGKMEEYAKKHGKDFSQIFKVTKELFEGMSGIQEQEQRLLLQRCVNDVEFLDHKVGVSEMEFSRFKGKLPAQYKVSLEQMGITFETAAKGKKVANADDMKAVCDMLLQGMSQTAAS